MRLVLLGPPGAGKGTQARMLESKLQAPQIASGDLLRMAVRNQTALGLQAKTFMGTGALVPDELVLGMIEERLRQADAQSGFILDGFPRTVRQAEWLDEYLASCSFGGRARRPVVINVDVGYNQLLQRLTGRRSCPVDGKIYNIYFQPPQKEGVCDSCGSPLVQRKDDQEEIISERLKEYGRQTLPLVDYYRRQGSLREVNGELPVEQVTRQALDVIEGPAGER